MTSCNRICGAMIWRPNKSTSPANCCGAFCGSSPISQSNAGGSAWRDNARLRGWPTPWPPWPGEGLLLEASEAEYDNVLQHLVALDRASPDERPHLMCLVPWLRSVDTVGDLANVEARVAADSQFWQAAWQHLDGTKLIQVGCDTLHVGPMGYQLSGISGGRAIARD